MFLLHDMLSRIQNALTLRRRIVLVLRSKFCIEILKVLRNDGFIQGFSIYEKNSKYILISLNYINNISLIKRFKCYSSCSKYIYVNSKKILKNYNQGFFLFSNSKYGIITSDFLYKNQNKINVGGILLFQILF